MNVLFPNGSDEEDEEEEEEEGGVTTIVSATSDTCSSASSARAASLFKDIATDANRTDELVARNTSLLVLVLLPSKFVVVVVCFWSLFC